MTLIDYNPWGQSQSQSQSQPDGGMKSPPAQRLGGPSPKLSSRMSDRFDRTKDAAAAGMEKTKEKTKEAAKKVKIGASSGVNWVKVKCNQSKLFPKK